VSLFRSLFSGRSDVYPRRYETRDGRAGYSPVCANEWTPGVLWQVKNEMPILTVPKIASGDGRGDPATPFRNR